MKSAVMVEEGTCWPLGAKEGNSVFVEQHERLADESLQTCC